MLFWVNLENVRCVCFLNNLTTFLTWSNFSFSSQSHLICLLSRSESLHGRRKLSIKECLPLPVVNLTTLFIIVQFPWKVWSRFLYTNNAWVQNKSFRIAKKWIPQLIKLKLSAENLKIKQETRLIKNDSTSLDYRMQN